MAVGFQYCTTPDTLADRNSRLCVALLPLFGCEKWTCTAERPKVRTTRTTELPVLIISVLSTNKW
jgi:hypothetical protein